MFLGRVGVREFVSVLVLCGFVASWFCVIILFHVHVPVLVFVVVCVFVFVWLCGY